MIQHLIETEQNELGMPQKHSRNLASYRAVVYHFDGQPLSSITSKLQLSQSKIKKIIQKFKVSGCITDSPETQTPFSELSPFRINQENIGSTSSVRLDSPALHYAQKHANDDMFNVVFVDEVIMTIAQRRKSSVPVPLEGMKIKEEPEKTPEIIVTFNRSSERRDFARQAYELLIRNGMNNNSSSESELLIEERKEEEERVSIYLLGAISKRCKFELFIGSDKKPVLWEFNDIFRRGIVRTASEYFGRKQWRMHSIFEMDQNSLKIAQEEAEEVLEIPNDPEGESLNPLKDIWLLLKEKIEKKKTMHVGKVKEKLEKTWAQVSWTDCWDRVDTVRSVIEKMLEFKRRRITD